MGTAALGPKAHCRSGLSCFISFLIRPFFQQIQIRCGLWAPWPKEFGKSPGTTVQVRDLAFSQKYTVRPVDPGKPHRGFDDRTRAALVPFWLPGIH